MEHNIREQGRMVVETSVWEWLDPWKIIQDKQDSVKVSELYLQFLTALENSFFNSLYKVATEVEQSELSQTMKLTGWKDGVEVIP